MMWKLSTQFQIKKIQNKVQLTVKISTQIHESTVRSCVRVCERQREKNLPLFMHECWDAVLEVSKWSKWIRKHFPWARRLGIEILPWNTNSRTELNNQSVFPLEIQHPLQTSSTPLLPRHTEKREMKKKGERQKPEKKWRQKRYLSFRI